MLKEKFIEAQSGDMDAALDIIKKFMPLMRKYANKIHQEDALYDLQCCLCELIYSLNLQQFRVLNDAVLISYVSKTMHSFYVKMIKNAIIGKDAVLLFSDLSDGQQYQVYSSFSRYDTYTNLFFLELQKFLTRKEYHVIYNIYHLGLSVAHLAHQMGTTRQNVNQIKRNAIKKIKKNLYV